MISLISDADVSKKNVCDLLVTSPGDLPLSYRRLVVGAKAIKLGPCDKRPAYC